MSKLIKLKITGMHCSSCEKIIQMDLEDVSGVIESEINSKTGTGLVRVEDSMLPEAIIKVIGDAGYKAEIAGDKNE
jgi:copper chaperone CopZ